MPTRIAILSDAHVSGEGPRARLLADAVTRVQGFACDGVVLLGDTVENGQAAEYQLVQSILSPIRPTLHPLLGNHDVQEGTRNDFRAAWHVEPFTADLIENCPVMRFDSAIASQPQDEAFGDVDERQLKLCDAVLASRRKLPGLIFVHHPLSQTVRRSEQPDFAIRNSEEVRTVLKRHEAPLVAFSGHTHQQSVFRQADFTAIGCPPLGYWPHAFLLAEIAPSGIRFQTIQVLSSPADSPDPDALNEEYRRQSEGDSADREGTIQF